MAEIVKPAKAIHALYGKPVKLSKGIEVGNIFKLGEGFHVPMGATYLGEDGQAHPIVMGSYGIGLGRNVACIVEAHHDAKGIVWPAEVAPYPAHLVTVGANKDPQVVAVAERLYDAAKAAGPRYEILYDDRDESPGVKFTDAELLGMPRILTVSPRSLAAGGVEETDRATGERRVGRSKRSRPRSSEADRRGSGRRRSWGQPPASFGSMTPWSAHQRIVSLSVSSMGRKAIPARRRPRRIHHRALPRR